MNIMKCLSKDMTPKQVFVADILTATLAIAMVMSLIVFAIFEPTTPYSTERDNDSYLPFLLVGQFLLLLFQFYPRVKAFFARKKK